MAPLLDTARTGLVLAALLGAAIVAVVRDEQQTGTIAGFECGDNCYLTIKTSGGGELTGLCVAEACEPWLVEAAMPAELVGKPVSVTVGVGQQLDNEGNVMGDFPSFTTVVVGE